MEDFEEEVLCEEETLRMTMWRRMMLRRMMLKRLCR
jgi:hypothetical protein